jgi:Kef-type K+ transport system membrane component KefB
MTAFLQFALALALLIGAARLGGLLSKRLGQPGVLGELLVGVLLGPSLLNFFALNWFSDSHLPEQVQHLAELGVIFLMFLAGLEIDLSELRQTGRAALLAGLLGVLAPVALGWAAAGLFGYPALEALFIGIVLSATSVSISAQTLMELGMLRRREGLTLLGAAVFDDVLVILVLSVFLALSGGSGANGGAANVLGVLLRMGLFLGVGGALGLAGIPWLMQRVHRWPIAQGLMSFAIVAVLLYAWAAEVLGGVAAITGAFLVGLAFARSPLRAEVEHSFSALTYGFFVPLFFVSIGLAANVRTLSGAGLLFGAVLIGVAALSKVLGSGLGAWWGGLRRGEALRLGLGMISRGEVGLIVASVGLSQGLIDESVFAEIVLVVLVTTLITPLLLRWAYARERRPPVSAPAPAEGE